MRMPLKHLLAIDKSCEASIILKEELCQCKSLQSLDQVRVIISELDRRFK